MAGLTLETIDLGRGDLDSVFFGDLDAAAVHSRLPHYCRRARELEAHGYHRRPPKAGYKYSYAVRTEEDLDEQSVRAIAAVVEELAPEDFRQVEDARRMSGDPRWIAAYCELDIQEVVAVLAVLNERETGYSGL